MTIITKGMGAIIKEIFKPRGKKITELTKKTLKKFKKEGVVDRNISSKKMFKIMKGVKGKD
jgi:hypothetical protein